MSDDLTDRLRATFVQELDEQVRELNDGLLALEAEPHDENQIRRLFRNAHTIKGAARVVGVPVIEEVCHAMESTFASVRDGHATLAGADFSLLFAACDALADAGARLRAGEPLDNTAAQALLPRLDALAKRVDQPAHTGAPTAAEPPVLSTRREDAAAPEPRAETPAIAEPDASIERRADTVRVRADRLDALLAAVGELTIAAGRVVERGAPNDESARRLDAATNEIADVVRRLRLRPFAEVCEGLPRAARDVATAEGREVTLVIEGGDVEADRKVMDTLRDPLLHLVRNAVDHGIEPPAERERKGKPRAGTIRLAAELGGGRLTVTVADDGAGLDEAAIRARLRERGRAEPTTADELADALLSGGFSTRRQATAISGRGVGLDIVRAALERIGGGVDVTWRRDAGTTFTLECPPTHATLRALLVRAGPHLFALPTAHVARLRRVRADELRSAAGKPVLPAAGGPIPVYSLAALLGPPLEPRAITGTATVVITTAGARRAALVVDAIEDEDSIVVRPVPVAEGAVPHVAGVAILPSGQIALLLGVPSLLAAGARAGTAIAPVVAAETSAPRRRVLVADDSITTRTLEQSVLEAAGYDVITAVNGEEAWELLQTDVVDALVADVEMPRMDGIALCRRVRATPRFAALPIVLVTGLESEDDRARGLDAGADAYIVKSSFDQSSLLDTVHQLIGGE